MKTLSIFLALSITTFSVSSHAIIISDGDFNSWSYNTTGTATMSRESAGGNPGSRLNNTTISGIAVYGTAIKTDFLLDSVLEGSVFNFEIDVLSGPGSFGQGQRLLLLVEQNSNIYATNLGITGFPLNWDTLTYSGQLIESSFGLLIGAGPAMPDFSGGIDTMFGFAGGNSRSATLTQYYDNFNLEIILPVAVPEPPVFYLLAFGILGMVLLNIKTKK